MNLDKKKKLAARTLGVGRDRIVFMSPRISDIKELITKQDVRDLKGEGAIVVKEVKGRRKNKPAIKSKGPGKVKKKVNTRKRDYVIMTRKLRAYVKGLKERKEITKEMSYDLRKKIRNKIFRSKSHLKDILKGGLVKNENSKAKKKRK
ncbi:MAG: 50S ribosomal protein L19e [Candidatus Pacearchaeota archaeon]